MSFKFFFFFFNFDRVNSKKLKSSGITPFGKKKKALQKPVFLNFFTLLHKKKAKSHAKTFFGETE